MTTPFLGEIRPYAFAFPPQGWVRCDGQLLPIAENDALFALIGTTYGGDGVNTFAVPDLRGRRVVGPGSESGTTYTVGMKGGTEEVTLLAPQLPAHNHAIAVSTGVGTQASPANGYLAASDVDQPYSDGGSAGNHPSPIPSAGGSMPHENRPPYLVMNFVMATAGIFPSRN